MNVDELIRIVEEVATPRVLLVGDLILDRYVWGDVERISPEAPIPVVSAEREDARVGGAGNAATNLRALGAEVALWGIVGDDDDGAEVLDTLRDAGIDCAGVVRDAGRRTTVKTRIMGLAQGIHPQQLLRIDWEDTHPVGEAEARQAATFLTERMPAADVVIVSDYAKGALSRAVLSAVFETARAAGVAVLVDPARGRPFADYRGASILKPNRYEAAEVTGLDLDDPAGIERAARRMLDNLDLEAAIITLEKEGMVMARRGAEPRLVPTEPRAVYDVTGAGDMVTATIGWAIAGGVDLDRAVELANVTGGLEVERLGVTPISRQELLTELRRRRAAGGGKIKTLPELLVELDRRRRSGQRIVWTNGCFDLLHVGHSEYLRFARRQGDVLVVGLNSDASVRRNKGPKRPIRPETERARVLSALTAVDFVVIFDDDTPLEFIKQVRPDALVKGEDWRGKGVVGQDVVEAYGGRVVLAPLVKGISTTGTVERIIEAYVKGKMTTEEALDILLEESRDPEQGEAE